MTADRLYIIQKILTIVIAMPFALHLWSYIICTRNKHIATNIQTTDKDIFRSIKLRYTNSAKLNIPLEDTKSFVSKALYGKDGPYRSSLSLERLSFILLGSSLLGNIALYCREYINTRRMLAIVAVSLCFYIFQSAFSLDRQMALTVLLITDYLENTLKHRISPDPLRYSKANAANNNINEPVIKQNISNDTQKNNEHIMPYKEQVINTSIIKNNDIIESVLQEYLA